MSQGRIVFLTGAGISAESGIPTFRGAEGYWTVGSRNYHPTELATHAAFEEMPDEIWGWYLYRRAVCRAAAPNRAHLALADLEGRLGDRVLVVTQNVDGLHRRAGTTRLFEIHGNIDHMRCDAECGAGIVPVPDALGTTWEKGRVPGDAERRLLVCPACGGRARPHVLWFDESYDEERFRFRSSLRAVDEASVLVVVGTSGATNLPTQMVHRAATRGIRVVVIDPEETPYARVATDFIRAGAGEGLPRVIATL